jgi:hypothetical protein
VIPADRKWYARLAAGAVILHELMRIDPRYPEVGPEKLRELADVRVALLEEREAGDARDHRDRAQQDGLETTAQAAAKPEG